MENITDTITPWTIKAFPTDARRRIVRAAEIQGVTVGQWIEQRLEEWEGNPVGNHGVNQGGNQVDPINVTVNVKADVLVDVLNAPGAPKWLRAGAAKRLSGLLGIPVPESRPGPKRRLAAPVAPSKAGGGEDGAGEGG
jgi:hypothetical protein